MDRRLTPFNGRVAHERLRGQVPAERFTEGRLQRVVAPLADLCAAPGGARDRQLLMGQGFSVLDEDGDHAFGQALRDGYVGWVARSALGDWLAPGHRVALPAAHLYPAPDVKAPAGALLSFGAEVTVIEAAGDWARTDAGACIARAALAPVGRPETDPVAVAQSLTGTPYLWGGNSREGIDCSGLVQAACLACAIPCPGDSDLQAAALGRALAPAEALQRADAVFWRGHVGLMAGPGMLIHANAHTMAVVTEPLAAVVARIASAGGGQITGRRRFLPGPAPAGT